MTSYRILFVFSYPRPLIQGIIVNTISRLIFKKSPPKKMRVQIERTQ